MNQPSSTPPPPGQRPPLRLDAPATLQAVYSNATIVSNTRTEFVFDFVQIVPTDPRARVQARVVMSPTHAKMLVQLLAGNIARYEAQHGDIKVDPPPSTLADQLFRAVRHDDAPDKPDAPDTP